MNEKLTNAILNFIEQSNAPELDWPDHWFEEVSFSQWAAGEMLNAIMDRPFAPAEDSVEEFAIKMEVYAAMSFGKQSSRIFSIAAQTAREFLEII